MFILSRLRKLLTPKASHSDHKRVSEQDTYSSEQDKLIQIMPRDLLRVIYQYIPFGDPVSVVPPGGLPHSMEPGWSDFDIQGGHIYLSGLGIARCPRNYQLRPDWKGISRIETFHSIVAFAGNWHYEIDGQSVKIGIKCFARENSIVRQFIFPCDQSQAPLETVSVRAQSGESIACICRSDGDLWLLCKTKDFLARLWCYDLSDHKPIIKRYVDVLYQDETPYLALNAVYAYIAYNNYVYIYTLGTQEKLRGVSLGHYSCHGLTVDEEFLYVLAGDHRIHIFDLQGNFLMEMENEETIRSLKKDTNGLVALTYTSLKMWNHK